MFPDIAAELDSIHDRLVDLLPIARNHYYHPDMHGSWSIKSVLPTIAPDLDYSTLQHVQHGGAAVEAYAEILSPDTPAARQLELIQSLKAYCARDTLAMVRLVQFFEQPDGPSRM
jgi:hypothetical protein